MAKSNQYSVLIFIEVYYIKFLIDIPLHWTNLQLKRYEVGFKVGLASALQWMLSSMSIYYSFGIPKREFHWTSI